MSEPDALWKRPSATLADEGNNMPDPINHSWLKQGSSSSNEIQRSYDEWAGSYDNDVADWDYRSPLDAAHLLKNAASASSTILDAGCGTGLVGDALRHVGFTGDIDGIDLSSSSLEKARERGPYRNLYPANFQQLPLALPENAYDALTCIGVLTYVPESEAILREFARVLRPGGVAIVTQRNDVFKERSFDQIIERLIDRHVFSDTTYTEPQLYLPANPDFGTDIQVIFAILTVA